MKKSALLFAFAALALCVSPVTAGDRLSTEFTFDTASKYVWRGDDLVDDQVYQPGVSISAYGVSLAYWGNIDATDINGEEHEFTEHDLTLSYGLELGAAGSLEAGFIYYYFPSADTDAHGYDYDEDNRDTAELYLTYNAPIKVVDVSVTYYYDVDEIDAWYASASVGKEFEMEGGTTASLGATVGYASKAYNDDYWGVKHADWNDLTLSAGLSGSLTKSIGWSLTLNYTEFLDGKIADGIGDSADNFWTVFGISTSF